MKRIGIVIAVLTLMAVGYGGTACTLGASEPTPEPKEVVDVGPEVIWASGTLLPARWATLAFEAGGRLRELKVEEGQEVAAGELLAVIDAPDLEHAVAQAEAALALAEAQLAQVKAGARPEEIAAAEAEVRAAEATLAGARAAVSTAKANVAAAQAAVPQSGVEVARAAVAAAEAELARLLAGPRPEAIAVAEAQVQQAATELAFAQNRFDRLNWVGGETAEQVRYQRDAAAAAHNTALAQLQLAKAKATPEEIAIAKAAVTTARAQLAQAEEAVKAAQAQVDVAEAGVETARAQVASAEAAVAQAKAHLDLLRAGARPEEIAAAQAQVDQARAALAQAKSALDKARLYAPFAGTVGKVLIREGELVTPGQPIIILGDLTHLRVETTDLRETDVAKVAVGQRVEVTFDALPGEVWQGTVTRIAPMSTVEQGSTNYTAIIELDQVDPRLRWGMTAYVNIAVGQ